MKHLLSFTLACLTLLLTASSTNAALVTISDDGKYVVNVLSIRQSNLEVPESAGLEVKKLADEEASHNTNISLNNVKGDIKLSIKDGINEKTLDVSTYDDEILEIEERPQVQRVAVRVEDSKFVLSQEGVSVETEYDINVDPKSAALTLRTPSGYRFLSILPREALNSVLRANTLDNAETVQLKEGGDGVLAYEIEGKRILNIFDIFDYEVPIRTRVSASTAEILDTDQPRWLEVFGFVFS